MPYKKETKNKKKKSRFEPELPKAAYSNLVEDLEPGQAFLSGGALFLKTTGIYQQIVDLETGNLLDDACEQIAIPVEITIKWRKK